MRGQRQQICKPNIKNLQGKDGAGSTGIRSEREREARKYRKEESKVEGVTNRCASVSVLDPNVFACSTGFIHMCKDELHLVVSKFHSTINRRSYFLPSLGLRI